MEMETAGLLRSSPATITAAEVVSLYFNAEGRRLAPGTLANLQSSLSGFLEFHGERAAAELRPADLIFWLNSHRAWQSDWTRKRHAAAVSRPFAWAFRLGLLDRNPFAGVSNPSGERGRALSMGEYQTILGRSSPDFRRVMVFLRFTGCRPCEMKNLAWPMVDFQRGCAVLKHHKTAKTRKDRAPRVIILHPVAIKLLRWIQRQNQLPPMPGGEWFSPAEVRAALGQLAPVCLCSMVRRLGLPAKGKNKARRYPRETVEALRARLKGHSEFVFLNADGLPWTKNALTLRWQKARAKAGLPKDCKLYGLRHLFGTSLCLRGVELKTLSELMGHTTTRMTEHYIHVAGRVDHLQAALAKAFA